MLEKGSLEDCSMLQRNNARPYVAALLTCIRVNQGGCLGVWLTKGYMNVIICFPYDRSSGSGNRNSVFFTYRNILYSVSLEIRDESKAVIMEFILTH